MSCGRMAEAVRDLGVAIDAVRDVPPSGCGRDELLAAASEVQRLRSRLDALSGSLLRAIGEIGLGDRDGATGGRPRSVAAAVAAACGADPRALSGEVRRGAWLRSFEAFAAAHATGTLSTSHLRLLQRLDGPRTRGALIESQHLLIQAASSCRWHEFVQATRYWQLAADPDGPEPLDQPSRRFCRLTRSADGVVTGRFRLDPVAGEAMATALGQAEQALFREDGATGSLRSPSQRRADALVELVARGASPGAGRPAKPLVHLVVSESVVEALLRSEHPDLDPIDVDGRCELVDGTPLHPRHAAGVLAVATLRRLVLNPRGEILDLGRRSRTFPTHLRQALLAAARGRCQIPGCDAPPPWLQADHIHPWHRGGPTATSNGQILCDPHNKAKGTSTEDGGGP